MNRKELFQAAIDALDYAANDLAEREAHALSVGDPGDEAADFQAASNRYSNAAYELTELFRRGDLTS